MNEVVNKFLLVDDKFMPEIHLKQPGFTYSACGPFTKNRERIENFMQTGNTNFIYKNKLDKACFQHDMAYDKTKDLVKRTQSDKVLKDKAFKITSDPRYDVYQRGLASMVYKFFDEKSSGNGIANEPNYQLASELNKPIIQKFKKRKVNSSYNAGKSDVAERFIRTLENKTFKLMAAISKNVYFDVLDHIVNKYTNTVHRTIKMKPIDVTDDSYAEWNENSNKKGPKFQVGDHVRISKYKNIFAEGYTKLVRRSFCC